MGHSLVNQLIHAAWSTNDQQFFIPHAIKNELYAYITTLINTKNGRVFSCGGTTDHIHVLFMLPADISLSNLLGHVKACTSKWIKYRNSIDPKFSWQKGYIAFSIQEGRINKVCNYIKSDEARHKSSSKSYNDELSELLKQQDIPIDERYYLQNSHSKICVHAVWTTNNRSPDLYKDIRNDLYGQIQAVITNSSGQVHAVGGIEDHVHVLFEAPKNVALCDLIKDIKINTSHWLKNRDRSKFRDFEWQVGYGGFSVSLSNVNAIKRYINRQEEHHRVRTYAEEWNEMLFILKRC